MKNFVFGLMLVLATLVGVSAKACDNVSAVNYGAAACNIGANYNANAGYNSNLVEVRRVEFAEVPGLALRSFANVDNYNNQVLVRNVVVDRNFRNDSLFNVNFNERNRLNLFGDRGNRGSFLNLNIGQRRNEVQVEKVKVVKAKQGKKQNKNATVKVIVK